MTIAEQIQERLAEFHPVYQDIHSRLAEKDRFKQAEQAQADYKRDTSRFDAELAELVIKKSDLDVRLRKLKVREEKVEVNYRPPPMSARPHQNPAPVTAPESRPVAAKSNQSARKGTRLELQKLIGKYGRLWKLTGEVRGSINRIAEDPARPLGEALVLLDWSAFVNQIELRESETDHLKRLEAWGEALTQYRDWLDGDMDMLRTKYRNVLRIIDAWMQRDSSEGQQLWSELIAETLVARQKEIETMKEDIEKVKAEIQGLAASAA